jgi:tRNA wybutosine-synthesizing protein 2
MPKRRQQNPIQDAITTWIASVVQGHDDDPSWRDNLLKTAPKRFIIYEPMAVLPAGSFTQPPWTSLLQTIDNNVRTSLWSLILSRLSKAAGSELTHLAVTEGIPLRREGDDEENILRSPSGLRMLYGDFGPSETAGGDPGEEDFERALWVSTKQNGIIQTWAPRWTMFSRGNVKEKARLLSFPNSGSEQQRWAVDLYAGIGYFVFCYASLGMRVLCWEINPWSVEGLRRGAAANRWSVKVVRGEEELACPLEEIMAGGEQIVVFLEDNQRALPRIRMLQESGLTRDVAHVNGGFLPTSEPTWRMAWEMTDRSSDVWLHLHENVGVHDMESRREALQSMVEGWATASPGDTRIPNVAHIEQVKTFAPGVWHCVFDVHITRPQHK